LTLIPVVKVIFHAVCMMYRKECIAHTKPVNSRLNVAYIRRL